MEKMEIYNQLRTVPENAKKKITGGRLNGMTDISPMWRIEKLTETFGPVGFGWKTVIKNKEIIDGANDEKIAIVDIELYVKLGETWSEAIQGTGGSSFVAKETKGLYTSDECFKMAYTDALGVACKALGMGADIYWGDSKYKTTTTTTSSTEKASAAQVEVLEKLYAEHQDKKKEFLDKYKLNSFADLTKKTASDLIKKLTSKKEEGDK